MLTVARLTSTPSVTLMHSADNRAIVLLTISTHNFASGSQFLPRLSRGEGTVVVRLKTKSSFANKWLFDRCLVQSPNCHACGEEVTNPRFLFCTQNQEMRAECGLDSYNGNTPGDFSEQFLFTKN